jgi:hypothetical protein
LFPWARASARGEIVDDRVGQLVFISANPALLWISIGHGIVCRNGRLDICSIRYSVSNYDTSRCV